MLSGSISIARRTAARAACGASAARIAPSAFILDEVATEGGKTFAIVIDEAHSSQGGKTSAAMSQALGAQAEDEDGGPDPEDTVNQALAKRMEVRKMLANASYFAFTATPKNKTLEIFGEPQPRDAESKRSPRPVNPSAMASST